METDAAKAKHGPEGANSSIPTRGKGSGRRCGFVITILSTGFGLGYSPVAPGTLGAAVGVGIYLIVLMVGWVDIVLPVVGAGLFFIGVYLSSAAEKALREKDSRKIVIDEIASFPLTMLFIAPSPTTIAAGFALNRAADIAKPFPAGWIQRVKGGWGIMLDDLVAAIYANLVLRVLVAVLKLQ